MTKDVKETWHCEKRDLDRPDDVARLVFRIGKGAGGVSGEYTLPTPLVDRIIADHEALSEALAALREGFEGGFIDHRGACQNPYGGECICGYNAWYEEFAAKLSASVEPQGGE